MPESQSKAQKTLLQHFQWRCVECVTHHEWDVREEKQCICVAWASNNERDCAASSLLLLAATVWSFAHMPFRISDRNKMVLWPGCGADARFSLHTKEHAIGVVRCKKEGMLLQPLRWRCDDCVIHHKRDVRKELHYICMARARKKRDCNAWSPLLLAATVRSFGHMPLRISDCNNADFSLFRSLTFLHST